MAILWVLAGKHNAVLSVISLTHFLEQLIVSVLLINLYKLLFKAHCDLV